MMRTVAELPIAVSSAVGVWVLGETMPMQDFFQSIVTSLGPVGIMSWFVWYTLTKRDPDKEAHYEKIIADCNSQHKEVVAMIESRHETTVSKIGQSLDKLACSVDGMVEHCRTKV